MNKIVKYDKTFYLCDYGFSTVDENSSELRLTYMSDVVIDNKINRIIKSRYIVEDMVEAYLRRNDGY